MKSILDYFKQHPLQAMAAAAGLLAIVGSCDYLVGTDISLLIFYLIPICFATWVIGKSFGVATSVLSVGIWSLSNNLASGAHAHNSILSAWNVLSAFAFFVVIIVLLSNFELFVKQLETRVAERTSALHKEMQERRRLEKENLEISERERRRIGHDLHDVVCQHLMGTRLAMEMLERKLSAQKSPQATDAAEVISLVEKALDVTRDLARGLSPVAMTPEGLMDALHQLADKVSRQHKISCILDYEDSVSIHDAAMATHFYLIAQEAVTNAVKHGKAGEIVIGLASDPTTLHLRIEDNGVGLSANGTSSGMGSRIMAYRAMMMNARFTIQNGPAGGVVVECSLPNPNNDIPCQTKE